MIRIDIQRALYGSNGEMTLDVSKVIQKGEFITVMGRSGAGKTTLLRILAGLEEAEGTIVVEEKVWLDGQVVLAPQKRKIGFVFQDYALFDNMTVLENLLFVSNDRALASQLLEMTELTALTDRNVTALSGGQKQRVSLCRAMMKKPELLLMDEPLSALDPQMRVKLQSKIRELHETFGTTTLMISHDAAEAYALADRVWMVEHGKIIKDGPASEVFRSTQGYSVEVLNLSQSLGKVMATVLLTGELVDIEVDNSVKIGDQIEIALRGERL